MHSVSDVNWFVIRKTPLKKGIKTYLSDQGKTLLTCIILILHCNGVDK